MTTTGLPEERFFFIVGGTGPDDPPKIFLRGDGPDDPPVLLPILAVVVVRLNEEDDGALDEKSAPRSAD